jgi:hypothetical protein
MSSALAQRSSGVNAVRYHRLSPFNDVIAHTFQDPLNALQVTSLHQGKRLRDAAYYATTPREHKRARKLTTPIPSWLEFTLFLCGSEKILGLVRLDQAVFDSRRLHHFS